MDIISELIEQFKQFPGIGPRQAKRFVYFLLGQSQNYRDRMIRNIGELRRTIRLCTSCYRYFPIGAQATESCTICRDSNRDDSLLLIVSRDVDFENIEKSHTYSGKYFILGGSVPILEKNPENRIRSREFSKTIEQRAEHKGLKEIILAMNLTPEGENTEDYLRLILKPLVEKYKLKVSTLGRGLSTGLELEYSDTETIKNALRNRV